MFEDHTFASNGGDALVMHPETDKNDLPDIVIYTLDLHRRCYR